MAEPPPLVHTGPAAQYQPEFSVRDLPPPDGERLTPAQHVADRVAQAVGSWPFIIIQSCLLVLWMLMNVLLSYHLMRFGSLQAWDAYPFICLNLLLSFQAAYTGPVVMMSQNRQSEKDRRTAENDYLVNQKAEREIQVIMSHLVHQDQLLLEVLNRLESVGTQEGHREIQAMLDRMHESDARILELLDQVQGGRSPGEA
ncbi:MAG: DUF1003 domain-containing protein [Armatimonadetes bacterium]|nr:DUF1003 domain-containing protein [Armatimonadota bacterium]